MKLLNFFVFVIVHLLPLPSECYRILGLFPINSVSHFAMSERLMKELAIRGHQVDVISFYPLKTPFPNYNDIVDLSGSLPDLTNNMTYYFATNALSDKSYVISLATQFGGDICDLMNLPEFKKFITKSTHSPPYDLAVIEIFGSNCYLAFGQHLKVPVVGVVTSPIWPWANDIVANPENPAYIPHVFSDLAENSGFWQRLKNTLALWEAKLTFSYYSAYQNDKIKKYIGSHAPSLKDAEKDVSLILVNSHYSLHGVRPFTTAVVEVGGLHIKGSEMPIPNDLQEWLDDSANGFIFISFGSMLKLESFPKETINAIYSVIQKLAPVRFLIKVAQKEELPPDLPSNALALPWIPQCAVLRHKNIRGFMTHGGLMSTQEAVYYGVPIIGVPLFADQHQNIQLYKRKKIAVRLDHNHLTEENLYQAFSTILHDQSYMKSAKKLSAEFQDRPMSAVDTAVFWVEYVIRRGGKSIRSPALDLAWWQIALLDVYGAILAIVILIMYFLKIIIFKAKSIVLGSNTEMSPRTKKNE